MIFCAIILILMLFAKYGDTNWPPSYKVDLKDHKSFVIGLGNEVEDNYDENEIEMIQSNELAQVQRFNEDDDKYKALHSHVEHYNRRAANITKNKSKNSNDNLIVVKEVNVIEPQPYVADFRHNIEEFEAKSREQRNLDETMVGMSPRDTNEYEELKYITRTSDLTIRVSENTQDEEELAEDYDYYEFKAEYYEQFENDRRNNLTFNYTIKDEPEDSPKDVIKKIIELKQSRNCTKEELTQFGLSAFQCLIHDYKHTKKVSDIKKILWRTWRVLKIWLCIYICIAIPCWCQKGWCCCCCRCDFCFPQRRIRRAKKYLVLNPPGVFVEQQKKGQQESVINYKSTVFEVDAYRKLESGIKNL